MPTGVANHVIINDEGVAWIAKTNTKVIEVVLDKVAYGWTPEKIHEQHPHLSLAQIHAALAYYYDHQAEIDSEIERSFKEYEALRAAAGETPMRRRLRSLGHLS